MIKRGKWITAKIRITKSGQIQARVPHSAINPNGPLDRFTDLQKQGFMKRAHKKAKKQVMYEAWTPGGVTYTGPNRDTADWHVRRYGGKVKKVTL